MTFKKVEAVNNLWKFEKAEDLIEGELLNVRSGVGKFKSAVYTLKDSKGQKTDVFGSKVLDDQMNHIQLGDLIRIVYKGMKKNYHVFEVYKDVPEEVVAPVSEIKASA